jgi:low affinity Fe/Cu permease
MRLISVISGYKYVVMPKSKSKNHKNNLFERFASWATHATGTSPAFLGAVAIVIIWGVTGPIFNFSETWQLVINTGTTIVTFLMVFLIQKSQNKDSKAIHLKLNELIAASDSASNRMVDLEDINEDELDQLHKFYARLADLAKKEADIFSSHSIDAAAEVSATKAQKIKQSRARKTNKQ